MRRAPRTTGTGTGTGLGMGLGMGAWRIALPIAGGAALLAVGGLYAAGLAAGDIPEGTRVDGVGIGGMSRTEAQQVLDRRLAPAFAAPVALKIGDRTEKADPQALGLSLDTAATAGEAARAGSGPLTAIGRLFAPEGQDIEPVIRMDETRTRAALARIGAAAGQQVRDGAISFEGGTATAHAPKTGIALNTDQAVGTLREAYSRTTTGARPVVLPVKRTQPRIGQSEVERAMNTFARPALSGPVTLTLAGTRISIGPATLAGHLTMKPDSKGRLAWDLDARGLLADPAVARALAQAAPAAKDAELRLTGDDRVVVDEPARTGHRVTEQALGDAVRPLLARTGPAARTGPIATTPIQPDLTDQRVGQLGIKEKVSSFTVNFPAAPYRSTNIGRAVELINGSLVLPGQEWSFNKRVGERTRENGFVDGIIINNGQYEKSPGGGVSAVATTMFNAMFFAGVKPVEYGAHSFYIERYPEGREATVVWGTLDLRFTNTLDHALYVQAHSTDTSVTITFLGTRMYDEIRATKGPRTHITQPSTRTGSGPTCEVQTPLEGFDVAVGRIFVQGGKEVGRENFHTHYTPRDKVTCTPQEETTPTPAPASAAANRPGTAATPVPSGSPRTA
ncbi:VanW family protein [Streptomyces sp. NPDC059909]|uniref:VanW family protein n=1 Tax=Streptomyces sp. NPDC059909 TaxID=3346998 RepID=UPI0036600F78